MLRLEDKKGTWFYGIKQIFSLFQLKLNYNPPSKAQIRQLIQKIKSSNVNYWRKKIYSFSDTKHKLYNEIKVNFGVENI